VQILFNLLNVLQHLLEQFLSGFIGALGTACGVAIVAVVKRSKNRK
jgi:hypothetical protein